MTEHIYPARPEGADTQAAAVARAEQFMTDIAPHLGRLFGMDLHLSVGNGWTTDLGSGHVTVDPSFFSEHGYTEDMSKYATLHEVTAHLHDVVVDPELNDRKIAFGRRGKPRALFENIFSDIAGNNLIHAALPDMKDTARDLYQQKLFPDHPISDAGEPEPYTDLPRHVQFLYKIIRQEMIPGSQTAVAPEVDAAIAELRNYKGEAGVVLGDLIKYSTQVAKSAHEAMPRAEQFAIWTKLIYPAYEKLLQEDRKDPNFQSEDQNQDRQGDDRQQDQNEQQQQEGQNSQDSEQEDKEGQQSDQSSKPNASPPQSDGQRFKKYYDDYDQNKHPEPFSPEEEQKIREYSKEEARKKQADRVDPEAELERSIREETGHSIRDWRLYNQEIERYHTAIDRMREVYEQIINQRVTEKRRLGRRPLPEGIILDPENLSQTVADVRAGVEEPNAYRNYELRRAEAERVGKTDYVFLIDTSGSMNGRRAEAAASSMVVALEGLAALQRDVEEAEQRNNIALDLDIRTAVYSFGEESTCLKPLSTTLTSKHRLDAHVEARNAHGGSTRDYLSLNEVRALPPAPDRKRIVVVVSDGESSNETEARTAIKGLRDDGWFVYGIGIESDAAVKLYEPHAQLINDPAQLPSIIESFIDATLV